MPVIRIQAEDGVTLWEGEGEVEPLSPSLFGALVITQSEVRNGRVYGRRTALTALTGEHPVRMLWGGPPDFDPDTVTLQFDTRPVFLGAVVDMLNEPIETAEEREDRLAYEDMRHRAMEQRHLWETTPPPLTVGEAMEIEREVAQGMSTAELAHMLDGVSRSAARATQGITALENSLSRIPSNDQLLSDVAAGYARNEEAITLARDAFPHDPHNYGHPAGNAMRWSPPADGEKVPRCP
jgi:hypothetical protein